MTCLLRSPLLIVGAVAVLLLLVVAGDGRLLPSGQDGVLPPGTGPIVTLVPPPPAESSSTPPAAAESLADYQYKMYVAAVSTFSSLIGTCAFAHGVYADVVKRRSQAKKAKAKEAKAEAKAKKAEEAARQVEEAV